MPKRKMATQINHGTPEHYSIGDQVTTTQPIKIGRAVIPTGTIVLIYGFTGDQYKVEYHHNYYWVSAKYLEVSRGMANRSPS